MLMLAFLVWRAVNARLWAWKCGKHMGYVGEAYPLPSRSILWTKGGFKRDRSN